MSRRQCSKSWELRFLRKWPGSRCLLSLTSHSSTVFLFCLFVLRIREYNIQDSLFVCWDEVKCCWVTNLPRTKLFDGTQCFAVTRRTDLQERRRNDNKCPFTCIEVTQKDVFEILAVGIVGNVQPGADTCRPLSLRDPYQLCTVTSYTKDSHQYTDELIKVKCLLILMPKS